MNAWERICKELDADKQRDARRRAQRRRLENAPRCTCCGGRIVNGRCAGDGLIRCGLWTARAQTPQQGSALA
jgi:hypothetical protein